MNAIKVTAAQIKSLKSALAKSYTDEEIENLDIKEIKFPSEIIYIVRTSNIDGLVSTYKDYEIINHNLTWDQWIDVIVTIRHTVSDMKTTITDTINSEISKGTEGKYIFDLILTQFMDEFVGEDDESTNEFKAFVTELINEVLDSLGDLENHVNKVASSEELIEETKDTTTPEELPAPKTDSVKIDSAKAKSIKEGGKEFIESPIANAMREEMQLWVDEGETISFAWKMALLVARYHIIRSVQRAKESQWNTGMYALKTRNLSKESKNNLNKALEDAKKEALATAGVSL